MSLHDIENRAKRLLEPFPGVKRAGKRVYQYTGYALSRNKIKSEGELVRLTPDDGMEYFFGYYDKCPWDADDRRLLALRVRDELEKQLPQLERYEIARESIDRNGKIIVAEDLRAAIEIANEIAPEHLELCVDNPFDYLDSIRHAGSVFLGRNCPEALGDYLAGPNHTLPTQGTARFSSPLSVDDFVKKTQYTYYTKDALERVAQDVAAFAEKEGLTGHARSAVIRTEE